MRDAGLGADRALGKRARVPLRAARISAMPRGRPFQKGASPNPGGRPAQLGPLRALAREHTAAALSTLVTVMNNKRAKANARVVAANSLLDRGYGKPGTDSVVSFRLPELNTAGDAIK